MQNDNNSIKEFIMYITTLWGILAGITTFFPIANILIGVIPLPKDPYGLSTAPIAVPLTTLTCIFVIYYSFVKGIDGESVRQSIKSFILAFISLIIFFLLGHFEYTLRVWLFPRFDSTDDYILMMIGIIPFYILFFAYITRAFTILALIQRIQRSRGNIIQPDHFSEEKVSSVDKRFSSIHDFLEYIFLKMLKRPIDSEGEKTYSQDYYLERPVNLFLSEIMDSDEFKNKNDVEKEDAMRFYRNNKDNDHPIKDLVIY